MHYASKSDANETTRANTTAEEALKHAEVNAEEILRTRRELLEYELALNEELKGLRTRMRNVLCWIVFALFVLLLMAAAALLRAL